jgi:hypothetical protein
MTVLMRWQLRWWLVMCKLMCWWLCWCVDVLKTVLMTLCWCVDVLMCWCVDDCVDVLMIVLMTVLMRWFVDMLMCWWLCWDVDDCVDVLMCWCVVCWCVANTGIACCRGSVLFQITRIRTFVGLTNCLEVWHLVRILVCLYPTTVDDAKKPNDPTTSDVRANFCPTCAWNVLHVDDDGAASAQSCL